MRSQPVCAASSSTAAFTAVPAQPRLLRRAPHSARRHAFAAAPFCSATAEGSLLQPSAASSPPRYREALAASLSRSTVCWETLVAQTAASSADAPAGSEHAATRLQRMRQRLEGSAGMPPFQDAFHRAGTAGARVEAELQEWQAVAHQRPAGFDSQAQLAVPGVAGEG